MRATRSRQKSGVKYFEAKPAMDLDDFRNQLERKARVEAQQEAEDRAEEAAEAARTAGTSAEAPMPDANGGAIPMDTDESGSSAAAAADTAAAVAAEKANREAAAEVAREAAALAAHRAKESAKALADQQVDFSARL